MIFPDSWLAGLGGGLLIGSAAALLWLANGRIAGISGIFAGSLLPSGGGDRSWRWFFLAGLLVSGLLLMVLTGRFPAHGLSAPTPLLLLAGLLVGYGTRLGSGCTSGHGVCGLARLSARSLWATATFMTAGFLTVWLIRHGGL